MRRRGAKWKEFVRRSMDVPKRDVRSEAALMFIIVVNIVEIDLFRSSI